jgi:hypothetical protein
MGNAVAMDVDVNTLLLFGIATAQAATAFFAWHTARTAKETKVVAERTELNTNSMREQLVLRTGEAEYGRGREEERVKGEAKAANLVATGDVADDRVATATERIATATEKGAKP